MPKVGGTKKLNRVARRAAALDPLPAKRKEHAINDDMATGNEESESNQGLSRGQRKRLAKREQYLKKEKMILSTLMLQRREEQKKRIDGLDAIREALIDTVRSGETTHDDSEEHAPSYGTNRSKKGLVTGEIERMQLVQQHPAFKEDPFATLQEHLKNSLAKQNEKRKQEAKIKGEDDKKKQEQRRKAKKDRLKGVKKASKKYKPRRCK